MLYVTLTQWEALLLLADCGSYKAAAERVNKTQSALFHAVGKLEKTLGQKLYTTDQKGISLTVLGERILPQVRRLIAEAERIEAYCQSHDNEGVPELSIAFDMTTPPEILASVVEEFSKLHPDTLVRIHETSLSGGAKLLERGSADVAVAAHLPSTAVADELLPLTFVCVSAPDHPCQTHGPIQLEDLASYCQIVIADTNRDDPRSSGWLQARRRCTVSHIDTSRRMLVAGRGFAWFPEAHIRQELESGALRPVPLIDGATRVTHLHLGYQQASIDYLPLMDFVGVIRDVFYEYRELADLTVQAS